MKLILFFIDGFGIGEKDPEKNPIEAANSPNIHFLMEREIMIPTDASLDVEGIPQSATGQTALLTGINASKILGHHLNGYPSPTLRKILLEHSVFKKLKDLGFTVTNANMYNKKYLDSLDKTKLTMASCSTVATIAASIPFRTVENMLNHNAVYQDITNHILIDMGYDVPIREPEEAAEILLKISRSYDFTFFEYFQTDITGHKKDFNKAVEIIELLDKFIGRLAKNLNREDTLLMITSDHGNIEDMSVNTHTKNKVPTFLIGNRAYEIAGKIKTILDITPAIIWYFTEV